MNIKVFDYGEGVERYTIFPYLDSDNINESCMYLGTCTTGLSVSMWGEIDRHDLSYIKGVQDGGITFIGRVVSFDSLPEQLRKHIIARIGDDT